MSRDVPERTYRISRWTAIGTRIGLAVIGLMFLLFVAGAFVPAVSGRDAERVGLAFGALAVGAAGAIVFMQARGLSTSAIRLDASGLQAESEGAPRVPWAAITGGRRRKLPSATLLTDAQGTVLAAIDDRLDGVEECLATIADAASFERPTLPARWTIRSAPWMYVAPALALAGVGVLAAVARTQGLVWVVLVVFIVVLAALLGQEAITLEIDESGLSIRRAWWRESCRWDEIRACGFRVRRSRNNRWIEAVVTTPRGTAKLVPAGAPMMPIVALVRERVRSAAPGR